MSQYPLPPIYEVLVKGANDEYYDFSDFTSLEYTHSLNKGSQAMLEIPLNARCVNQYSKATRLAWLYVYRQDYAGGPRRLIWYGNLMKCDYDGTYTDAKLKMVFEDLASLLGYRYTSSTYAVTTATDTSDIMWDAIDYTQGLTGGDLGITLGVLQASKNRTAVEELKDRTIKSILEGYAEVEDGVDWTISPTLQNFELGEFNTFFRGVGEKYHKGNEIATPLTFKVDDTGFTYLNNANGFSFAELGEEFANSVRVKGATVEDTQLSSSASDSISITAYGRFETLLQYNDISEQDTLDDKASEALSSTRNIPFDMELDMMPHVDPRVTTFDIGDLFMVDFKFHSATEFQRQYRLYETTVKVDNQGIETVNMGLNVI